MKCREAERLFYEAGEERLDPGALASLRIHEESCSHCRREFTTWRAYRNALRSREMRIAPPPGFAARVMSRLDEAATPGAESRRPGILETFWKGTLVRGVAAAAVVLALLTGSLAYAEKYWFNSSGTRIVQDAPRDGQNAPVNHREGKDISQVQETISPQEDKPDETVAGQEAGYGETGPEKTVQTPPQSNQEEPTGGTGRKYNFLENKKRVITTTMLKTGVADIEQAHQAALGIALSEGAQVTSTVTARNNGQTNLILRCTVPPAQAESLLTRLEGLGTVKTRDTSVKDVSENFSRTLEEYRSLDAKLAEAPESEKERLRNQAEFLARQLEDWDEASKKQVVVIWLES